MQHEDPHTHRSFFFASLGVATTLGMAVAPAATATPTCDGPNPHASCEGSANETVSDTEAAIAQCTGAAMIGGFVTGPKGALVGGGTCAFDQGF